jgi:adenylosuccinate lyase
VRAERISGLARVIRTHLLAAMENIGLWHERDISHSSTERIIFPDSFILTDFILAETTDIIKNWKVNTNKMEENINLTRGLIFSQSVLLALTKKDVSREQAYQLVQKNSLTAWNEGRDFKELIQSDEKIGKILSKKEIDACFSLEPYLSQIDYIFEKVLGDES